MAMEGRKCDAVIAASSSPQWVDLPGDVTANILQRLGEEELLRSAQLVCSTWWRISKDPTLWRVLNFSNPDKQNWLCDYDLMCRCAVDRSRGQLVDLTVEYYGFDINYIANRSPNLKRLRIGVCFTVAGYVIAGVCPGRITAKLPQLEELHLTIGPGVGAGSIKALGYACPNLKSFSLNSLNCKFVPLEGDEYESLEFYRNLCALAISLSMPNLWHLQLFAHWIEDEGLEDILDSCPHLESLDVRDALISVLKEIWRRGSNILNSLMTPSVIVMFRGPTVMAAICLVLTPILKNTYTNIMKTRKLIIVNTMKTSSPTSSKRGS